MGNLVEAIKASLSDLHTTPWLPEVTGNLVKQGWETLRCDTGISVFEYGTARVLEGQSKAPRHVVAGLSFCLAPDDGMPQMLIEMLTGNALRRYQNLGLTFHTPDEITNTTVIACLQDAIDMLAHVPTLQNTVAALVRVCHLLKPKDDDYDVSHSDPQIPFSIFVSVPKKRRPNDALRVVESIVHEAMHLQLTLLEQVLPLVHSSDPAYFSPWKGTHRSPRGVLHALYVFRVIDRFLECLQALPAWSDDNVVYMRDRRDEIARQIGEIETFKDWPALTAWGATIVRELMVERRARA